MPARLAPELKPELEHWYWPEIALGHEPEHNSEPLIKA